MIQDKAGRDEENIRSQTKIRFTRFIHRRNINKATHSYLSHASLRGGVQGRIRREVNRPLGGWRLGTKERMKKGRKEKGES